MRQVAREAVAASMARGQEGGWGPGDQIITASEQLWVRLPLERGCGGGGGNEGQRAHQAGQREAWWE